MKKFPTLDELLDYGEEYKIPDLIKSDYFIVDNKRKQQNNQGKENSKKEDLNNTSDNNSTDELEDGSKEDNTNDTSKESNEQNDLGNLSDESNTDELEDDSKEESTNDNSEESNEQNDSGNLSDESNTDELEDDSKEENASDTSKESNEQNDSGNLSDESNTDELEDDSKEENASNTSKESNEQNDSGNLSDESSTDELEDDSKEDNTNDTSKESNEQNDSDNISDESSNKETKDSSEDENDFDDLLNNYDEDCKRENERKENASQQNASNKINDITPSIVYKTLKRLVSLSYENYQKGTYKYNKKEIIKHYLTEQKYKILDDLISPVFKPDVYVFDLSPSNDNSLEMYVNAISSLAIKGSVIYLTFNNEILRKLLIKKQNSKSIDVKEIVNSLNEKYRNLECTVYNEYQSLYEELKDIKDRKIYIFSDLDVSDDMVKLSKNNKNIVWFSTENNALFHSFFEREVPNDYEGLYVDTKDITDIEKYIKEKNKSKYRRRHM